MTTTKKKRTYRVVQLNYAERLAAKAKFRLKDTIEYYSRTTATWEEAVVIHVRENDEGDVIYRVVRRTDGAYRNLKSAKMRLVRRG